eukprot:c18739_g1_i1.p1 GENE.c18739_g1_i1~~c18739_g1_i1.p1  ORF type:complete len:479 (+),score=190.30 c18739_g1_i1:117-1553(+)
MGNMVVIGIIIGVVAVAVIGTLVTYFKAKYKKKMELQREEQKRLAKEKEEMGKELFVTTSLSITVPLTPHVENNIQHLLREYIGSMLEVSKSSVHTFFRSEISAVHDDENNENLSDVKIFIAINVSKSSSPNDILLIFSEALEKDNIIIELRDLIIKSDPRASVENQEKKNTEKEKLNNEEMEQLYVLETPLLRSISVNENGTPALKQLVSVVSLDDRLDNMELGQQENYLNFEVSPFQTLQRLKKAQKAAVFNPRDGYVVGVRVFIHSKLAVIRFRGNTHFSRPEDILLGIEFLEPVPNPSKLHDGVVDGTRYFTAKPNSSMFLSPIDIEKPFQPSGYKEAIIDGFLHTFDHTAWRKVKSTRYWACVPVGAEHILLFENPADTTAAHQVNLKDITVDNRGFSTMQRLGWSVIPSKRAPFLGKGRRSSVYTSKRWNFLSSSEEEKNLWVLVCKVQSGNLKLVENPWVEMSEVRREDAV